MGRKDSVLPPKLPKMRPLDSALKGRRSFDSSPTAPKAETPKRAIGLHPPPTLCKRIPWLFFHPSLKITSIILQTGKICKGFCKYFLKTAKILQKTEEGSSFLRFFVLCDTV